MQNFSIGSNSSVVHNPLIIDITDPEHDGSGVEESGDIKLNFTGVADMPVNVPAEKAVPGVYAPNQKAQLELDKLLLKVSSKAYHSMTIQDKDDVVAGVKVSWWNKRKLNAALERLQAAMTALDGLRGSDFVSAFTAGSRVNKVMTEAIEAQLAMAELLESKATTQEKIPGARERIAVLIEQCKLRAGEISCLAGELATMAAAQANASHAPAELTMTVAELLPRMAAKSQWTSAGVMKLRSKVEPLLAKLADFRDNAGSVDAAQLNGICQDIQRMKDALAYAEKFGIDCGKDYTSDQDFEDGGAIGEKGRVFVDSSVLSALRAYLDESLGKVRECRASIVKTLMSEFVAAELKDSPYTRLVEKIRHWDVAYPSLNLGSRFAALLEWEERYNLAVRACRDYAKEPTPENRQRMKNHANSMPMVSREQMYHTCTRLLYKIRGGGEWSSDVGFENSIESFQQKLGNPELASGQHFYLNDGYGLKQKSLHLEVMHGQHGDEGALDDHALQKQDVIAVFEGTRMFSAVIEARVHGVQSNDFNVMYNPERLVAHAPLGKGNANEVEECTFRQPDGTMAKAVFKPEYPGISGVRRLAYAKTAGVYGEFQTIQNLNMACQENARLFHLDDVLVKNSLGTLKGQYGLFMEHAKGKSPSWMSENPNDAPENGQSLDELKALAPDRKRKVKGQLMHKLSNLQWIDIINGQGDRHRGNYMVHVDEHDHVEVKGIDNDAAFPKYRMAVDKLKIDDVAGQRKFRSLLKKGLGNLAFPRTMILDNLVASGCLTEDANGLFNEVDLSKCKDPEIRNVIIASLRMITGVATVAYPSVIERGAYEAIKAMAESPDKKSQWLDGMRKRMPEEAAQMTLKRFEATWRHIQAGGVKIIDTEDQWMDAADTHRLPPNPKLGDYMDADLFDRDFDML